MAIRVFGYIHPPTIELDSDGNRKLFLKITAHTGQGSKEWNSPVPVGTLVDGPTTMAALKERVRAQGQTILGETVLLTEVLVHGNIY